MFYLFKEKIIFQRGFTFLELIVVLGIFAFITGIVLVGIPGFKQSGSLDLAAQQVATYVRGAQVYGTSMLVSPKSSDPTAGSYPAYGVRMDKNSSNNIFFLYPANCTSASAETCQLFTDNGPKESYTISSFFKISKICQDNDCTSLSKVDIIFMRPKPVASFFNSAITPPTSINPADIVSVEISSKTDATKNRCISIYRVGQIRIKQGTCP